MIPFHRPETPGRFERKFVIENTNLKEVETRLRLHPAFFKKVHQSRSVNNIYLDSPEYRFFFDNVEGNARRRKVRVRWYGNLQGKIRSPRLEIKEKSGHIGWKRSFALPEFSFSDKFDGLNLQKLFEQANLPEALINDLRMLRPSLVNRYRRKYLLSWDGLFRLTLDEELAYYRVNHLFSSLEFPYVNDQEVIVELKYLEEHDSDAQRITNAFHWRLGKNSKYVSGVSTLSDF